MITLLNTSILTEYGEYSYRSISCQEAAYMVQIEYAGEWQSAIGHQATADILTDLLNGVKIPVNRIEYRQQPGERAIVFKLNGRPPEGAILSREELEKIGYSFGLLTRTA